MDRMKKRIIIIAVAAVLAGTVVGIGAGVGITLLSSPEFALQKMQRDIEENGMEALEAYLTGDALEFWDTVETITDNSLINSLLSIFNFDNNLSVLKSVPDEVIWTFDRIENKQKDSADVFLDFNYEDRLIGEIEFRMTKTDGNWMISKIEFPIFDEINW